MKTRILGIGLALLALVSTPRAEVKLPALFGDHMVLQQGSSPVWGTAAPGARVTVALPGQKLSAVADEKGKWRVVLTLPKAGGPYDLVVSGDGAVTLTDVLVGDVWLGSGQSNMELPMTRTHDAAEKIAHADNPKIRLFTVEHAAGSRPADDVKGSWKVCTPDTVKDFSAVAYHFGRDLQEALKTPVGLIADAWGGSSAEAWVPRAALEKEPRFAPILKEWDGNEEMVKAWGDGYPYDLELSDIRLIPKDGKGKGVPIRLEKSSDSLGGDWNCSLANGSTGTYKIEGKGPKGGPVAVLSGLMKGQGWITLSTPMKPGGAAFDLTGFDSIEFYAKGHLQYRVKFAQASISDYNYYSTDILSAPDDWQLLKFPIASFKQGDWGIRMPFTPEAVQSLVINPEIPYNPDVAGFIYNGMVAPMARFNLKGVLWYQGEANSGRAGNYTALLTLLIQKWREAWGKDLPFFIVQLPNFMAVKDRPSESSWAELREAQLKAESVPHTAVVTTIDLGEADNIHPKNKTEVGRRISLAALKMVYGKQGVTSGPRFASAVVQGGKMILTFTETGKGLSTLDGKPVTGFALCDEDRDFQWAKAKITGPGTLEVGCEGMANPIAVRYAWADNPVCNLSNKEGLPASPFRYSTEPEPVPTGPPAFESWAGLDGSNAGVYTDTKGSTIAFTTDKGPDKGQKSLKLTFNLKSGGYCGLWHNMSGDLSGAKALVFKAKTSLAGDVQVALKDKWNVQYIARATVPSNEWTEVKIPLASFVKDTTYAPPNAQLGHPMDLSNVSGMNFGPQPNGVGDLWIGPVTGE